MLNRLGFDCAGVEVALPNKPPCFDSVLPNNPVVLVWPCEEPELVAVPNRGFDCAELVWFWFWFWFWLPKLNVGVLELVAPDVVAEPKMDDVC